MTKAQQYLNSAEFQFTDLDCAVYGCANAGPPPGPNQSDAYPLHNVHIAHSAGLTGAGQIVAVVDNGFRLTHQEFAGKTISQIGTLPVLDHGTHVISLIAAIKDGVGMHGIAPGADLHLTSFDPVQTGLLDIINTIAGTEAAAGLGAVVQNNSWGFSVAASELANYLNSNPGAVAAGLHSLLGYGTSNWQSYMDALDNFQANGVIVWALSNDASMTTGDVLATLPSFAPSLAEAWIAALNGYFEVNGSGDIVEAARLSAACGYAARFCLATDGTTWGASAASDAAYSPGTGASFSAALISGSVALLAEAFPDLSPEEWTNRILATADNSWFGAEGVSIDEVVDFGDGITHGFSDEWGHGVLDLRAALSPIQTVVILAGETVSTARRFPLDSSNVTTVGVYGDALTRAFGGFNIAVLDSLNGDFRIDAGHSVHPQSEPIVSGLIQSMFEPSTPQPQGASFANPTARALTDGGAFRFSNDLASLVFDGGPRLGVASVYSLASSAAVVSSEREFGRLDVSVFGFAAGHQSYGATSMIGVGVNVSLETSVSTISFGFGQSLEQGALLGLVGNDAFDFGIGSLISSANLGFASVLGPRLSLFGDVEIGIAAATGFNDDSLVASLSPIGYRGFQLGATIQDVLARGDSVTLSFVQPMRIESGTVQFVLPVSRTAEGAIVNETVTADLSPSGRQRNLALSYETSLWQSSRLSLRLQYSFDAGNIAGARAFAVAGGYRHAF